MTMLDKFLAFAKSLPSARQQELDEALGSLMATFDGSSDFSAGELDELDKRVAEPRAEYSDPSNIEKLLGKRFSS